MNGGVPLEPPACAFLRTALIFFVLPCFLIPFGPPRVLAADRNVCPPPARGTNTPEGQAFLPVL
jgi:hypothetical protein